MTTTQQNPQDSKEIFPEKELVKENLEQKEKAKENFQKSKVFEYLTSILEPTKESEKILDSIIGNYEILKLSSQAEKNVRENLEKNYILPENISKKELAIINTVEIKIWKNLDSKDKLELVRILSWTEIKEKQKSENIETSDYSKENLANPEISKIEWLYFSWEITKEEFKEIIKSPNLQEALEKNPKIKEKVKILEQKEQNIDFNEIYWNYIPEDIKNSFIIKELEKEFFWPIELNEPKAKEYNLYISLKKLLNKTLEKHPYFYKPDTYYEALDFIRKQPWKEETINEFFLDKLRALAYVMQLATWENPWRIDEKNQEAWEQKKSVELKEKKEVTNTKNSTYEKIIKLIKKNEELWQKKIVDQKEKLAEIKKAEKNDPANNPDFDPDFTDIDNIA